MTGKEAYERYMTSLAGKIKFREMPKFENLNSLAQDGWNAAVSLSSPVHDEYKATPVVVEPVVEPVDPTVDEPV